MIATWIFCRSAVARFLGCSLAIAWSLAIPAFTTRRASAQEPPAVDLFRQDNLVAWCIVPFDARNRTPEARAEMLARLGFKKFAYDWRAEHIPTFDAEIAALKKHGIELTAWWFPAALNDEAQQILAALKRGNVTSQLWITMGDPGGNEQAEKVANAVKQLAPIIDAAAAQGCTVGLYNHGGWFGEPENQIAIIQALQRPNVGIVYNQHHGHDHLDRFAELLAKMKPYLYALNLNGMVPRGDQVGQKILPLGQGELDLALLKTIAASGYRGPIGILGHTQDDAEARLADNLDGLRWLVAQLEGKPAGPKPQPRTPVPAATRSSAAAPARPDTLEANPERFVVSAPVGVNLPAEFDAGVVAELVQAAQTAGDAYRGLEVFRSLKFACLSCHKVGEFGGAVGPVLTDVGRRLKPEEIAAAFLWPKHVVKPEFSAWQFWLIDGRSVQGYKRTESSDLVQFVDPATQKTVTLAIADIEAARETGTLMPDGLANAMTPSQRRDLLRFLLELGHTQGLENDVRPGETPAQFAYDRAPLDPRVWSLWEHPVNRDRIYDFYRKEALHFRTLSHRPHLLPAFPGLDGGAQGHWGNQNEDVWKDARWSQRDKGPVLAGVTHLPGGVVPKGVCVQLGDERQLATCFNPETLTYDAVWKGGFVTFSAVRHGFMDGLRPEGEFLPRPEGQKPSQPFVYRGYYRVGSRVIFSYRVGDVEWLDAPWEENGQFERVLAPADKHPLAGAIQNPPSQWPQELRTTGILGPDGPYTVDTILLPFENPWNSLLFPGDHDFLSDGTALLCTMTGDVWRVTGLDAELRNVRWKRFASGLHQPLGLAVVHDEIYVLGRDQITRLVDRNGDHEADFYECHSNAYATSSGGHDFTCGLACDKQGRFYTASSRQGLIRISADGQAVEVLATGFRNPDGLGLCPDGAVTVPCSEGEWTPASMICLVQPGQAPPPHFGYQGPKDGKPPALPLVYLPRGLDNSSGGQAIVCDERFGPLAGQIIHTSFGAGAHFLVLRDEVAAQPQGAVVPLPGEFRSGVHRGKVNPKDGQLYVSGMAGWGSYTPDDGCFHRVRYTGKPVQLPIGFHVHENGIRISFAQPMDPDVLGNLDKPFAQAWNYRYGPGYGSPELAPSHPGVIGHDAVEITGMHRIDDTSLFVEIPDLQPVSQLHLLLQVDSGPAQELFVTVHRLDSPFTEFPGYRAAEKVVAAHPQAIDLALLGKQIANPWQKRLRTPPTATLEIAAGPNLTYSTRTLRAKAGESIQLTFTNPDVVPHNWVLLKPDSLATVGKLANLLVADPEAVVKQYVPASDDVLVYTDIVPPGQQFTIYFTAPAESGRYPYLCSFPGHWMVMNGELIIE